MKVSKVRQAQKEFQPYALSISVDSLETQKLLKALFGLDYSVPKLVADEGKLSDKDHESLKTMFVECYKFLEEED